MALILNFDVPPASDILRQSRDCKLFNFYDTTGLLAPGGYSSGGNPPVGTILSAQVAIVPYLSTATPSIVNVKSTLVPFPNTSNIPFPIPGTSMGLPVGDPIPSGIYTFTYLIIYPDTTEYNITKNVFLDCLHQCCADKLWAKFAAMCGCSEKDKKAQEDLAIKVQGTITAIHKALAADCLKEAEAQNLVTWLNGVCDATGCGCSGK